jgi:hypothetical protein
VLTVAGRETRIPLENAAKRDFSIIDFSPDKQYLLLSLEISDPVTASEELESQELGLIRLSDGKITTWSIWKVLGWKACDATIELQGFLPDGKPVIRARPSIWSSHPRPNCVSQPGLFSFSPAEGYSERLADATKVIRYGEELHSAKRSCKADPDLAAQCFTVHGRLDFYNGGPTTRIWVIGTHHILGVYDEIVPENVSGKLDWNTDVFADFLVCPFTRGNQGHMQPVCIESARNVRTVPRQ